MSPDDDTGLADARLAAIVESSNDAIVSKTLDGVVTSWNPAAERLFGYAGEEIVGRNISTLAAPGREDEMPRILERLRRGEKVERYETVRQRKDGALVEVELTISPIRDRSGRIVGASKIARDITERRQAEEQQRLLAAELSHRIKNMFAVVQVVAERTAERASSVEAFLDAFRGRLQALNAAQGAVAQENWQGTDLADLVRGVLAPYLSDDARLRLDIPRLALKSEPASTLALALHELATNAAKYGALSHPAGRIDLGGRIEADEAGGQLRLVWQERGGPPVEQPEDGGFGTSLLERAIGYQYGGTTELVWRQEGLVCRMDLPLDAIALGDAQRGATPPRATDDAGVA